MPKTVKATLYENKLFRTKINIKSEHTFVAKLSAKDRERIQAAKTSWMNAKPVDLGTYRELKQLQRMASGKALPEGHKGGEAPAKSRQ